MRRPETLLKRAMAGNEDAALELFTRLRSQFGWAGTFFTRADAETQMETVEDGDVIQRRLTDDQWEVVRATWEWRKGLDEILTERGWELIHSALREAGVTSVEIEA